MCLAKEADDLGAAIEQLIERFVDWQFARRDENKFLEVTLRSGRKETLYRSDLISGAIIASIVERAKAMAIKRAIATRQEEGIQRNGSAAGVQRRVHGERYFPDDRYHRGLAQADRLRSGKRRQDFAGETGFGRASARNHPA